jgi:hypothetical protein
VQEAVLDALPTGRSARLHADVAAQLERDGTATPDELARHLWAARDVVGAAAVPALMSAAGSAASVFAHEQAEEHLRRALTLVRAAVPPEPGTELTVLLSLFRLIVTARGWGHTDARAVVDRAMELAGAGTYDDQSARLWWSLFFFLLDRDDKSYVEVASTLLASFADLPPTAGPGPAARPRCTCRTSSLPWPATIASQPRITCARHARSSTSHPTPTWPPSTNTCT